MPDILLGKQDYSLAICQNLVVVKEINVLHILSWAGEGNWVPEEILHVKDWQKTTSMNKNIPYDDNFFVNCFQYPG